MKTALCHVNPHDAENDVLHTFDLPNCTGNNAERTITIRLADRDGERNSANMLIKRKYSARGYGSDHKVPTAPCCVTFTASSNSSMIGTLSLTVDSPAGLACDKAFKEELDRFRALPDTRLCELTRFAFDTSKPSMHLLASLFHIIFIYGTHRYDRTDLFIEVHPRHRHFYEAMLGFQSVGAVKTNEAVGAMSNLMWLKVSDIRRRIDNYASGDGDAKHSLYRFFFSRAEEAGIYNRLCNSGPELAGIARPLGRSRLADADMALKRRMAKVGNGRGQRASSYLALV